MAMLEQINSDIITAAKNNEPLVRDTLRMIKTSIKNAEINKGRELTDEEVVEIIAKEVKQRQEAAASFINGGRPELAEKEEQEIALLQKYLPEQLTEEEVIVLVDQAITETSASQPADMGKVMGALMPKVKGKADGNLVSRLVREKLNA